HHVLAIRALGVDRFPAGHPRLKQTGCRKKELLDALAHVGRCIAGEDGRERWLSFRSQCGSRGSGHRGVQAVTCKLKWHKSVKDIWHTVRVWTNWPVSRITPEDWHSIGSGCSSLTLNRTSHCRPWRALQVYRTEPRIDGSHGIGCSGWWR